jgi:FAD/FMN-containing dehydrogenase
MSTTAPQLDRSPAALTTESVAELRDLVAGLVLAGGSSEAEAEIAGFQLHKSHHPDVVVAATSTRDIAVAVAWAVEHGLPVAVQSTGHGAVAPVPGGVMITTRRMSAVTIDPVARTATLEAGVRWAQVIEKSAPYGLTPLVGSSQGVGAMGYTLGGGLGLFARKHGFAADHVVSLQLVTADGAVRHVDAEHEPELFWALRGGKGNFGIVTSMTVELLPIAEFWGGPVFFAGSHAREVLEAYRTWAPTLPEEAMTSIALLRVPPTPEVPEPIRGQFVVHLRYSHCGDPAEAEALLAPMLEAAPVVMALVGPTPVTQSDVVHQDPKGPLPGWEHGGVLRELTSETIDALLDVAGPQHDLPVPIVEIRQLGGALARPAAVPNAVSGRGAAYSLLTIGIMAPGLEQVTPAVSAGIVGALAPWAAEGALVNFLGAASASAQDVRAAYDTATRERLLAVKTEVDPTNVFRFGHALL